MIFRTRIVDPNIIYVYNDKNELIAKIIWNKDVVKLKIRRPNQKLSLRELKEITEMMEKITI